MEIKARDTYLIISPRKLRALTKGLVGLPAKKAKDMVNSYFKEGRVYLNKIFSQAIANAINNFKLQEKDLLVKRIEVDEGPRMKRRDISHGARFDSGMISKRMAHITLILESKDLPKVEKKEMTKKIEITKKVRKEK